jgi:hypothetical protein
VISVTFNGDDVVKEVMQSIANMEEGGHITRLLTELEKIRSNQGSWDEGTQQRGSTGKVCLSTGLGTSGEIINNQKDDWLVAS